MPLYEYQCAKCGNRFEKIEKLSAPHKRKCPNCGGKAERLLSAPGFQFKGSGWYVTDYARAGAAPTKDDPAAAGAAKEPKEGKETKEVKEVKESKEKKETKKEKKHK